MPNNAQQSLTATRKIPTNPTTSVDTNFKSASDSTSSSWTCHSNNAGLPRHSDPPFRSAKAVRKHVRPPSGANLSYPEASNGAYLKPEASAQSCRRWAEDCVQIIGGCCRTTVDHIRAWSMRFQQAARHRLRNRTCARRGAHASRQVPGTSYSLIVTVST